LAAETILGDEKPERSAMLFGVSDELKEKMGINSFSALRPDIREKSIATIHQLLNETAFQEAWDEGRKMTLDEAVQFAIQDY
jgi:hypothetical protein